MNDRYVPVKDQDGWFRDTHSGAIVNLNQSEYDKYMSSLEVRKKKRQEMEALQTDVNELKSDLNDIKSLLKHLVEQKNDSGTK